MTIPELRQAIRSAGLSTEAMEAALSVLDQAEQRGGLTAEHTERLETIVGIEVDVAKLEADALDETAEVLEEYANELDGTITEATDEAAKINQQFEQDLAAAGKD